MAGLRFKTWRVPPGRVVRGLLRLRHRRGARRLPGRRSPPARPTRPGRRSSAARRSSSRSATSSRSPRAGTASTPPRGTDGRRVSPPGVHSFLASSRPSPTGSSTGTRPSCSAICAAEVADRDGLLVALGGVGDPVVPQGVVEGHHAAGAQQAQRLGEVGGVLASCRRRRRRCRSGRRSAGGARRARRRRSCAPAASAMPASAKVSRARRWCSASMSTVVSTPSGRMPRSSHSPETPVPVPISTTARASSTEARKRSVGAAAGADRRRRRPRRRGRGRRRGSRPRATKVSA